MQSLISNSFGVLKKVVAFLFFSVFSDPEYGKSDSTLQREVTLQVQNPMESKRMLKNLAWKKWPQRQGNLSLNSN